jgi:hypothetical protein
VCAKVTGGRAGWAHCPLPTQAKTYNRNAHVGGGLISASLGHFIPEPRAAPRRPPAPSSAGGVFNFRVGVRLLA